MVKKQANESRLLLSISVSIHHSSFSLLNLKSRRLKMTPELHTHCTESKLIKEIRSYIYIYICVYLPQEASGSR